MRFAVAKSAGGLFRKYVSDQGGAGFYKVLFWLRERAGKVALDIEFTYELVLYEDGHNDLTLHQGRSGKITWIFRQHHALEGSPRLLAAAPQSPVLRGMRALGVKLPAKGPTSRTPESARIDEIRNTYPVITSHLFVQTLRDTRHDGLGRWSGFDKTLKFLQKFFVHRHSVLGPPGG